MLYGQETGIHGQRSRRLRRAVGTKERGMKSIILDNIESIKALCLRYNVKSLYAFGSVCTEKFNDNSDIDLLISFYPMDYGDYADSYFELAEKLEDVFQRPVDLVTDKSLGNPYFIESINQTKTPIYEA